MGYFSLCTFYKIGFIVAICLVCFTVFFLSQEKNMLYPKSNVLSNYYQTHYYMTGSDVTGIKTSSQFMDNNEEAKLQLSEKDSLRSEILEIKRRLTAMKNVEEHQQMLPKREPAPLPSFIGILKMVADDDFNLTCHHTISLPKPHDFIQRSKNPCFRDQESLKLKCLPYFYMPGFPKCGTTDLFSMIKFHPEFVGAGKEHHWFNHLQYREEYRDFHYYLDHFNVLAKRIQRDIDKDGHSKLISGDLTPDYLCDSLRWKCIDENEGLMSPKVTNAHAIHRLNPNAKIIVMMREPVSRLYSRFKHMIWVSKPFRHYWGKPSPELFHQAAVRAIVEYNECFKRSSSRDCLYNGTLFNEVMMNDIGLYPTCLADWLSVYPRENFLFLLFEDYIKDKKSTVSKVFEFLEMAPPPEDFEKVYDSSKIVNIGPIRIGPMLDKTKILLRRFFAPFVKELQNIVGEELISSWGY